jgi:hypothetical protein
MTSYRICSTFGNNYVEAMFKLEKIIQLYVRDGYKPVGDMNVYKDILYFVSQGVIKDEH